MYKFILFTFLAFSLGACKKSSTDTTSSNETNYAFPDVPKTESDGIQDYMVAYEGFMEDYRVAVKNNDQQRIAELKRTSIHLSKKASNAMSEAKGEDVEILNKYMKEKKKELDEISKGQ